ncbi:MAG: peptide chain release factor N(5)-glutamine methyltransferase [Candidatus Omnitrophica bacterium]|nr:peptide chain release factor N(5)-glutamine methyltransferase [Candidatus Omnitrophota bacterium]MDD5553021.1 peptide chain release factor N(5)-glutamine methyltransferase [Candidatus Omnitrophota bacterium]
MNETELLFTDILNCSRWSLYLNKDITLRKDQFTRISEALKRRVRGEPVHYILGKTEFMGLDFKVSPEVLIPRPETEILVEEVIRQSHKPQATSLNILDVGTGSGCIAISLAKFIKKAAVIATDISSGALKIAEANAKLNNVIDKIRFIQSDFFKSYELRAKTYDIIVSNPPYIVSSEIEKLQPEVQYEPRIALDGGKDGLSSYRKIIEYAPEYLREGGFLILEMGFGQAPCIKNVFQNSMNFEIIEVVKDYNNIDRVIVAKKYG